MTKDNDAPWGTSGELIDFDHDAVLQYCQQFYFGG